MPRPKRYESMSDYKNKWASENYDRINLTLPKGKKKMIQDYLKTFSPRISVNEYINKLIDNDMSQE